MTVYLVGAGPGDPGLLTVRGAEVLARADVVVFDRLSVASLLDLAPPSAERISVGKTPGHPSVTQDEINHLLVERGRTGATVVRLKGGDPFVFARGGEEARALHDAGVPFEVVPGITSAIAAPAYAGIPLTLRHSSTSFTVVTGHEDPSAGDGTVDWGAVARVGGTIVVLMGVARIRRIAAQLLEGGLPPDTPAAAVTWGTRADQRTVRSTLAAIADEPVEAPAVYVIGRVAGEALTWFESKPLFGLRVVVTRARAQASQLAYALRAEGAEPIEVPVIRIDDPPDGGASLRSALGRVDTFDWLVLTSPNGVERTFSYVPDARALGGVQVAAIGPGTAAALAAYRVVPDLVPERFVAEALLDVFPPGPGRVLLARAHVARDVLPDGLRAKGWDVEVVDAYRTIPGDAAPDELERAAAADAICFTSSSTVERYVELVGVDCVPPVVACIGPVTAATAQRLGLTVNVVADRHTIDGLVRALVDHLRPA
ncbi:MAG: uroporphyrinogen-III C-methyltransferase [Acidimicrobiales bacterium]